MLSIRIYATIYTLLFTLLTLHPAPARVKSSTLRATKVERSADAKKLTTLHLPPVYCFSRKIDMRRYARLLLAVKKVYPYAKVAKAKMQDMEAELATLPTKQAQKAHIKGVYRDIIEEYTPILKRMTRTQGRILVRLIDRESEYTAYEIVKEFRGGFVASFWQGIGKMFGQNLKSEYGSSSEDKIIEQIIIYYEAGLL